MNHRRLAAAAVAVAAVVAVIFILSRRSDEPPSDGPSAGRGAAARPPEPRPRASPATSDDAPAGEAVVSVFGEGPEGRRALSDAAVRIVRDGSRDEMRGTSYEAGVARFRGVADGGWTAYARTVGHEAGQTNFAVSGGAATSVVVVLARKALIRGTVVDAGGAVMPRAEVQLRRPRPRGERDVDRIEHRAGPDVIDAVCDDAGAFVLRDVPVGVPVQIWSQHRTGGIRCFDVAAFSAGEERTVPVVLERVTSLHGEFSAEVLGAGEGNVDLFRWDGGALLQTGRKGTTPAQREYLFQPVLAGEKVVAFSARQGDRFYAGFQRVDVAEGDRAELGVWKPTNSVLKLRLRPLDARLVGRNGDLIVMVSEGPPRRRERLMHLSVPIGRDFEIRGLDAGKYSLAAAPIDPSGMGIDSRHGEARDDFEFDGVSAERELVLEPQGGVGPKGLTRFVADLPPGVRRADSKWRWILWSDGRIVSASSRAPAGIDVFNSGIVPAGRYRVDVFKEKFVASKEYDQADTETDAQVRIAADSWTSARPLAGRVLDDGKPVPNAVVLLSIEDRTGARFEADERRTDAGGAFVLPALPRSTALSVHATSGRKASVRVPIDGFQGAADLVLELK